MNEDKIILPVFLIADLYKESLVEISNISDGYDAADEKDVLPEKKSIISSAPEIKYLGENKKNITVIINQKNTNEINKDDFSFLSNILKACQLQMPDIAIINAANQQLTFAEIKKQLQAKQVFLFDIEPSAIGLPFKIPDFQIQNYDDCIFMPAPALSVLNKQTHEGKVLKTKLWNSLKKIFAV